MTDTRTEGSTLTEVPQSGTAMAHAAEQEAMNVASEARQQVSGVVSDARAQASQLTSDAKEKLRTQADEQATKVAASLHRLSDQFRALGEGRAEEAGAVRRYVDETTWQLDRLAARMDDRGLDGLVRDLQGFARRRPGTFLVGAAAAGFAVGRVFRSARDESREQQAEPPADEPPAGAVADSPHALPVAADVTELATTTTVTTGSEAW